MAFELSFSIMYKDIPIAVFPFREVLTILHELNKKPTLTLDNGTTDGYRVDQVCELNNR